MRSFCIFLMIGLFLLIAANVSAQIQVNPTDWNPEFGGSSQVFHVDVCTQPWTAQVNGSWLNVNPMNGAAFQDFTITCQPNNTPSSRTATVTISGCGGQETVTIIQQASPNPLISGRIVSGGDNASLSGVTLRLIQNGSLLREVYTDNSGNYHSGDMTCSSGSITITPTKQDYTFDPPSITVSSCNQIYSGQNFTGWTGRAIRGRILYSGVGIGGVNIVFSNGGGSCMTNGNGNYAKYVRYGWTGTATPSHSCVTSFSPSQITFSDPVNANQFNQNFVPNSIQEYTVTMNAGANGGITGSATVFCGSNYRYQILADDCYAIDEVRVNGAVIDIDDGEEEFEYALSAVSGNSVIQASFVRKTLTVTANAIGMGSVEPSGVFPVECGGDLSFRMTGEEHPNCTILDYLMLDGISQQGNVVGNTVTYTFPNKTIVGTIIDERTVDFTLENVTRDHRVNPSYVINIYPITTITNGGGSITPNVTAGSNCGEYSGPGPGGPGSSCYQWNYVCFTVRAEFCHHIDRIQVTNPDNSIDVIFDPSDEDMVREYSFCDSTNGEKNIEAFFEKNRYDITVEQHGPGASVPHDVIVAECYSDTTVTIVPADCYEILQVLVDDQVVPVPDREHFTHLFEDVTTNHTVTATFVRKTFRIALQTGEHGTGWPVGSLMITCDGDTCLTIPPARACFRIGNVYVDGVAQGAITSYCFENVVNHHTLRVEYRYDAEITVIQNPGGVIAPSDCQSDYCFRITPNNCRFIEDVLVDGVSVGALDEYCFSDAVQNHTIEPIFGSYAASVITGQVRDESGAGVDSVALIYGGQLFMTDGNGNYSIDVNCGPRTLVMPYKSCWNFSPSFREYVNVVSDIGDQDFEGVDGFCCADDIDVAVVIDRSGSMEPVMDQTLTAAMQAVSSLNIGDNVSVVTFNHEVQTPLALQELMSIQSIMNVRNIISNITETGGTDIGAALLTAQAQLNSNPDPNFPQVMILLSDGQSTNVQAALATIPASTTIHTIGLSEDADQVMLSAIASHTGGEYHFIPGDTDDTELSEIFQLLSARSRNLQQIGANFPGTISPNLIQTQVMQVDGMRATTFSLAWEGNQNNLNFDLIHPDGTVINPGYANNVYHPYVSYSAFPDIKLYTLTALDPGLWTLRVSGASAEEIDYVISTYGCSNTAVDLEFGCTGYKQLNHIILTAFANEDDIPISGATVEATVRRPNGENESFTLLDDGAHHDGAADDGFYGAAYPNTDLIGSYTFTVNVSGTAPEGGYFERSEQLSIVVEQNKGREDILVIHGEAPVNIDLLANDIGGDSLSIANVSQPLHGVVVMNPDQTITYTPNENFPGVDQFTYTIDDGNGDCGRSFSMVSVYMEHIYFVDKVDEDDRISKLFEVDLNMDTGIAILTRLENIHYESAHIAITADGGRIYAVAGHYEQRPHRQGYLGYYEVAADDFIDVGPVLHNGEVLGNMAMAAFSPDGVLYVGDAITDEIYTIDVVAAEQSGIVEATSLGQVMYNGNRIDLNADMAFDPDGNMFLVSNRGNNENIRMFQVIDTPTGLAGIHIGAPGEQKATGLAFLDRGVGNAIVSVRGYTNAMMILDPETGNELYTLPMYYNNNRWDTHEGDMAIALHQGQIIPDPITEEIPIPGNQFAYISLTSQPVNPSAEQVFSSLENLALVVTNDGDVYIPGDPDPVVNDIGNVVPGVVYRVLIEGDDDVLTYIGTPSTFSPDIVLYPIQWNWVSSLCSDPIPVESYFSEILEDVVIAMDESNGLVWIPGLVNTIGDVIPGVGYKVYTQFNDMTLFNYDCETGASPVSRIVKPTPTTHFVCQSTGLAYNIVINDGELENAPLSSGAEIGVFDGDRCVGSAVVGSDYPLAITAWEASPDHDLAGFIPGNAITFKVWQDDQENSLKAVYEQGDGSFGDDLFAVVTLTGELLPSLAMLHQNYPNPFNPTTTIRYQIPWSQHLSIRVYSVTGQLVRTLVNREQDAGYHKVVWDGKNEAGSSVSSGIYFYQLTTDHDFTDSKRMILMK